MVLARDMRVYDPAKLNRLMSQAERDGVTNFIISAEAISTFNAEQITRLLQDIGPGRTQVIICLRHWSSYWPSRWKEYSRSRDSQSFPTYLRKIRKNLRSSPDVRFDRFLSTLTKLDCADVRVLSYDRARQRNNLLESLLTLCDIDPRIFTNEDLRDQWKRESLGVHQSELVRLFNGARAEMMGHSMDALFDANQQSALYTEQYWQSEAILEYLENSEQRCLKEELNSQLQGSQEWIEFDEFGLQCLENQLLSEIRKLKGEEKTSDFFLEERSHSEMYSNLEYDKLPQNTKTRMQKFIREAVHIDSVT